jgi:hypothetical protein
MWPSGYTNFFILNRHHFGNHFSNTTAVYFQHPNENCYFYEHIGSNIAFLESEALLIST